MTSLGIHRRSQTCELTPRGQQGRQHAHAADTGIRVREEKTGQYVLTGLQVAAIPRSLAACCIIHIKEPVMTIHSRTGTESNRIQLTFKLLD